METFMKTYSERCLFYFYKFKLLKGSFEYWNITVFINWYIDPSLTTARFDYTFRVPVFVDVV